MNKATHRICHIGNDVFLRENNKIVANGLVPVMDYIRKNNVILEEWARDVFSWANNLGAKYV